MRYCSSILLEELRKSTKGKPRAVIPAEIRTAVEYKSAEALEFVPALSVPEARARVTSDGTHSVFRSGRSHAYGRVHLVERCAKIRREPLCCLALCTANRQVTIRCTPTTLLLPLVFSFARPHAIACGARCVLFKVTAVRTSNLTMNISTV